MHQFPRTVQQVVGTEVVMKMNGLVPFVHAMPAASKVLMKFYEASKPHNQPYFLYLRSPFYTPDRDQIPPPKEGCESSYHLSLGYSLTSGIQPLESPASWGFVNHFGPECRNKMNDAFYSFLKEAGLLPNSNAFVYFQKKGYALIRKYCRFNVGEFVVFGISPEKVDRYVYDAKPYNLPTGEKASDVASHPKRYQNTLKERGQLMASMVLCKETLLPNRNLVMVLASGSDFFRASVPMTPMNSVAEFDGVTNLMDTSFETKEHQERATLNAELEKLAEEFGQYRKDPKKTFPTVEQEPFDLRDSIACMP